MADTAESKPVIIPLNGTLTTRSHATLDFAVYVPAGTPREWLLSGDFWVHHVRRMITHCEIRVIWEDGSAYARILCTHHMGRMSRFVCLEYRDLDQVTAKEIGAEHGLVVQHRGAHKWCVVDTKTGDVLLKMFATQDEANAEMEKLIAARNR